MVLRLFDHCIRSILAQISDGKTINLDWLPVDLRRILFDCMVNLNLFNNPFSYWYVERPKFFQDFTQIVVPGDSLDSRNVFIDKLASNFRATIGISDLITRLRIDVNASIENCCIAQNYETVSRLISQCRNLKRLELKGFCMNSTHEIVQLFKSLIDTSRESIGLQELSLEKFRSFGSTDFVPSGPLFDNLQSIDLIDSIFHHDFLQNILCSCVHSLTSLRVEGSTLMPSKEELDSGRETNATFLQLPNLRSLTVVDSIDGIWYRFFVNQLQNSSLTTLAITAYGNTDKLAELISLAQSSRVDIDLSLNVRLSLCDADLPKLTRFFDQFGRFIVSLEISDCNPPVSEEEFGLVKVLIRTCRSLTKFVVIPTLPNIDLLDEFYRFYNDIGSVEAEKLEIIDVNNSDTSWTSILHLLTVCQNLHNVSATLKRTCDEFSINSDQQRDIEQFERAEKTARLSSLSLNNTEMIPYQQLLTLLRHCGSKLNTIELRYSDCAESIPTDLCRFIFENCKNVQSVNVPGYDTNPEDIAALEQLLEENWYNEISRKSH